MDLGSVLVHDTKTPANWGGMCYNQKLSQMIWQILGSENH